MPKSNFIWCEKDVLNQLFLWNEAGHRCAVITLVGIDGSSPRPIGSQMVVRETGEHAGFVTSGCAEADIARRALQAIEKQTRMLERYGKGSPYMDIRLPCGSGIDVLIDPFWSGGNAADILSKLGRREQVEVAMPLSGEGPVKVSADISPHSSLAEKMFHRLYKPQTKIICFGDGPIVQALQAIAHNMGWFVEQVVSGDKDTSQPVENGTLRTLKQLETYGFKNVDARTALVLLLHDHQSEPRLLKKALDTDIFYLGALGSRRTHKLRCDSLRSMEVSEDDITRINGPAGLDIGGREPQAIALSIIAEIVKHQNEHEGE